jgi:hypothetical protein
VMGNRRQDKVDATLSGSLEARYSSSARILGLIGGHGWKA